MTYIITARNCKGNDFGSNPGVSQFVIVNDGSQIYQKQDVVTRDVWRKSLAQAATRDQDPLTGMCGSVLVFVHGYNNDIPTVLWRTRKLQETLSQQGWKGVVVGFDWPSDNSTLNYLEDRSDAAKVAQQLVTECLGLLVAGQKTRNGQRACQLDVHLIGHSTGAYAIMEAFAQAETFGQYYKEDWRLGQVVFIGGDVAADSLRLGNDWSNPMFKRIMRLTNYSNGYDEVLAVSNAKRLGVAPRAGRVGLPADVDPKGVNVDCAAYFLTKNPAESDFRGTFCHSWHIGDMQFALDLALTLEGAIDREKLPTRVRLANGLVLRTEKASRPLYQGGWKANDPSLA